MFMAEMTVMLPIRSRADNMYGLGVRSPRTTERKVPNAWNNYTFGDISKFTALDDSHGMYFEKLLQLQKLFKFFNKCLFCDIMEERLRKIEEKLEELESKVKEHDSYIKSDLKQEFAEKDKFDQLKERLDFIDEKIERQKR